MECYYRSKPFDENGKPIKGYKQRLFKEWRNKGLFESTEGRICDQARGIRKNGWLLEIELETIKRSIVEELVVESEMVGEERGLNSVENIVNVEIEGNGMNNISTEYDGHNLMDFGVEDETSGNNLTNSQREIMIG